MSSCTIGRTFIAREIVNKKKKRKKKYPLLIVKGDKKRQRSEKLPQQTNKTSGHFRTRVRFTCGPTRTSCPGSAPIVTAYSGRRAPWTATCGSTRGRSPTSVCTAAGPSLNTARSAGISRLKVRSAERILFFF